MIELNKIYNEDCIAGMKRIPDASIDAVICDLPFGTTQNQWDSVIPFDGLWEAYRRIIKPNGVIALFAQTPFDKILGCSNLPWLKYEWIWEKENATGFLNCKQAPMKIHENILVFSPAGQTPNAENKIRYNPQMGVGERFKRKKYADVASSNYGSQKDYTCFNDGIRYPTDILHFARDNEKLHPTQKPVDLVRYLVRTYTNEGETVLDNCSGSGTTAVACIREKRNFIGFELNKEYYDIANKRIENEYMNQPLF